MMGYLQGCYITCFQSSGAEEFAVWTETVQSPKKRKRTGGSVLAPLLWLIFIDPLSAILDRTIRGAAKHAEAALCGYRD